MNRTLWTEHLTPFRAPAWPCPKCKRQSLKLVPKSIQAHETASSVRDRANADWDPYWISKLFCGWLRCPDSRCAETVAVTGIGGPQESIDPDGDVSWEDEFRPLFANPMPDMFELPASCPKLVAQELRASFSLYWSDQPGSANRLRRAIERLLDHVGVKKRALSAKRRMEPLTLHARIVEYQKREPEIAKHLLALKWLGNSGSHDGVVKGSELLDAMEVAEHCLAEILSHRSKRIGALSSQITKAHAPRRRRR